MRPSDFADFRSLMKGVHDFYARDLSEFSLSVWWESMRSFDLPAVQQALNRHVMNPDTGQFMPKPADAVRMLAGRTVDSAQVAWAKVDRALRTIGTYRTVVFDDPLIHRVLSDMGGWVQLGAKTEEDWPFVAKEFETRYRGFAMRGERPEYPRSLPGITEAENGRNGFSADPPALIGDARACESVMVGGSDKPLLGVQIGTESVADTVKRIGGKNALPDAA